MKKLLLLTTLLVPMVSQAADLMPTKAQPVFAANGAGWYVGLGTEAAVAQSSVTGNNLFATSLVNGNLKAAGGAVKGVVGYIRSNCVYGTWCRVEVSGQYQNIVGSDFNGSIASRWASTQEVDVGVEILSAITSAIGNIGVSFPSFTPPTIAGVAATPRQYVGLGAKEFGINGSFFTGTGSTIGVAPMIKTGYLWQTINAAGQPNGGAVDAYAGVAFNNKGFTINNAFAPSGSPTISGKVNMGTTYWLGVNYDFGV